MHERVVIARYGTARLTVDGDPIGDGVVLDSGAREAAVLEIDPVHRRVRVAVRGPLDLFLWVDASCHASPDLLGLALVDEHQLEELGVPRFHPRVEDLEHDLKIGAILADRRYKGGRYLS